MKFALASLFEDYVQIILQYFYFEKYLTGMVVINDYFFNKRVSPPYKKAHDTFVYFNAILMLISSVLYLKTLVKALKEDRNWLTWFMASYGLLGNKVNQR